MPITDWPTEDRPQDKLLIKGEEALTDAELIAIFLKTGIPGKTALDVAKELLIEYGGLKPLLRAPLNQLLRKKGLGRAKCAALKAAIQLGRRYMNAHLSVGEALDNSQLTQTYLAGRLREHSNEVFACLFMDTHFHLISFEELFHGTINEANIYPREIVKRGLAHNAAKVILAHNHPSGCSKPSEADKEVTYCIKQALSYVDIEVVDHIIIGDRNHFSFAEAGLI